MVSMVLKIGSRKSYDSVVMAVTMMIAVVFLTEAQFIGFSGSSGPSNSMLLGFLSGASSWTTSFSISLSAEASLRIGTAGGVSVICCMVLDCTFPVSIMMDSVPLGNGGSKMTANTDF